MSVYSRCLCGHGVRVVNDYVDSGHDIDGKLLRPLTEFKGTIAKKYLHVFIFPINIVEKLKMRGLTKDKLVCHWS